MRPMFHRASITAVQPSLVHGASVSLLASLLLVLRTESKSEIFSCKFLNNDLYIYTEQNVVVFEGVAWCRI